MESASIVGLGLVGYLAALVGVLRLITRGYGAGSVKLSRTPDRPRST